MSITNTFELFKYSDYMLSASVELLKAQSISVYGQRGSEDIRTPAVELQVNIGTPIGHVHVEDSSVVYDSFNGTLNATIVSNRTINDSNHSNLVTDVYYYLGDIEAYNSILPYHGLLMMKPNGYAVNVQADENTDISAVTFDFIIYIKPESWPSYRITEDGNGRITESNLFRVTE